MIDNVLQFRRPEGQPGEIADAKGAIWLTHRRKITYGEAFVTSGKQGPLRCTVGLLSRDRSSPVA